jgi:hypothetical protein
MLPGISRYAGATTVIAALAATAVVALAAPGGQQVAATATGEMALTDDDGGQPMFTVPEIKPGETVQRCIRLRYSGENASRVALSTEVSGKLATQLRLQVERGTGAGYETCDGFEGTPVYRGTLAEAADQLENADVWRADAGSSTATYRFTISAPPALTLDREVIHPTFAWVAEAVPTPVEPTPTATVTPPATGPKTVTHTATAKTTPAPPATPHQTAPKAEAPAKDKPAAQPTATPASPAPAKHAAPHADKPTFLGTVAKAVGEAAQRAAFPLALLVAMFLFLLFQNRLDRRDPKLAMAPIHSTPDLPFEPLPRPV